MPTRRSFQKLKLKFPTYGILKKYSLSTVLLYSDYSLPGRHTAPPLHAAERRAAPPPPDSRSAIIILPSHAAYQPRVWTWAQRYTVEARDRRLEVGLGLVIDERAARARDEENGERAIASALAAVRHHALDAVRRHALAAVVSGMSATAASRVLSPSSGCVKKRLRSPPSAATPSLLLRSRRRRAA
ncbi:hypothetical protein K438DRAFT_1982994 [Mycena galopus ATCC 62051]|nr:hypothetical protein K438DRAFT_1982994 [Mycena galopus ATCC 62051]